MKLPVLDANLMLRPALGGAGLDPARLEGELAERFGAAHARVQARRAEGETGFLDLPWAAGTTRRVQELADSFGQLFENVVVVGIGGSGLGAVMLRDALLAPRWNELTAEERDYFPRLHVLDNPDPSTVSSLLDGLELGRTLFNVVSKSGSTAETMALYLVAREHLARRVEPEQVRAHFLFTTDPDRGALRRIAEAEGIATLAVPPNVGGRYSVLSPVGLWPAAATGVDVDALLAGARAMAERCMGDVLLANPAGLFATLLHAADVEQGRSVHVLMPYGDRLRSLALWFQQLWAESLGKELRGPTPLPALGASDQHSQVQLFMEGPQDKVVVFVAAAGRGDPVPIPRLHGETEELGYLGGHTLGGLLDAERRATTEALRRAGRPSLTLELGRIDAHSVGALAMLLQIATLYAGALYGVDPLDQPGVELGKRLACGLLGRAGFDVPVTGNGDPRWRV